MKKANVALSLVAVVGAAAFWWLVHRRPTLPGSPGLFGGLLPPVASETRSIREIKGATESPDAAARREALRSLGRLEDHRQLAAADVLPYLVKGAGDSDGHVRAVATAYLGQIRVDAQRVVPLLIPLLKDPDGLVRMNAAAALRLRGEASREALPALLEALNDENQDVRVNAVGALLYFKEARYEPPQAWTQLPRDEAAALARKMGLAVTGESLHRAVRSSDLAGVYLLLKAGVDPNSRSESKAGETPLFLLGVSRPEAARFLLDAGADVHFKDNFGRTASDWIKDGGGPHGDEKRRLLREAADKR